MIKKSTIGVVIPSSLLLIVFFCSNSLMAQSPGGVSAGLKLWLKTNTGVSTSGSNVTGWIDQSATNTFTVTGSPQLTSSGLNFNPGITFNGSSYFTGNTSIANSTEAFAVASIQNASGVSGSGAVLGNTAIVSGNYFFHTEAGVLYYGNSGAYSGTNAIGNSFGWQVMNADLSNATVATDRITVNGILYANSPGGNPVAYSAVPTIGSRMTEPLLNGSKVAEVILYNASKSTGTERSRIQSYLAVKYGLTLGNTSNLVSYLNSAGTTIWTGDATYQNNIIGIGKDNGSGLEQQISTSQSTVTDIITISTDNNFTNVNGTHTAIANDNYFLITGNNNLLTTYTAFTSANANVTARMNRIWKIQETGTDQGIVYIKTSSSDATYILTSPDATFGDGNDTYTALSSGAAGVNFSNGQFFTFGTYLPAPGGVLTNLAVWYKSNSVSSATADNTAITSWTDNSGNSLTATGYNSPTYRTGSSAVGVNFNPAMSFNGTNQYFQAPSGFANFTSGLSLFSTHQFTNTGIWARIMDFGNAASSDNILFARNSTSTVYSGQVYNGAAVGGSVNTTANAVFTNVYGITGWIVPGGAAGAGVSSSIYLKGVNNVTAATTVANNITRTINYIGRSNWGADAYFAGYMPEFILYSKALTATEQGQVISYVALKYGFTLGTPGSPVDYKASDGTTFWTGNATYQYNVMGIGKDNLSGLEQQVSKSMESTADIITLSTDNNFTNSNGTHAAVTNDKYFLMVGNNNSAATYSAFTSANANVTACMSRIWKVQETGTDQGVVYIKTSNADATYILTSPDATFGDGNDTYTALTNGAVGINFSNGQFFTFGAYLSSPGGVLSNLAVWYKANSVSSATADNTAITSWTDNSGNYMTATGYNSPVYRTGNSTVGLNFNPAMSFNGTNQYFQAPSGFANFTSGLSLFSTHQFTNTGSWARIMDFGLNATSDNILFARNASSTSYSAQTYNGATASALITTTAGTVNTNVYGMTGWIQAGGAAGASVSSSIYLKGVNNVTATSLAPSNITRTINYVGRSNWGADAYFSGYMPELILYNKALTATEQSQVISYVALKYGFTLGTPGSPIDYKASDGTTVWTGNATYQYNVIGIGKDNLSGLEQQISKSTETTADIITLSTDNNFVNSNGTHTSITNNKYFLIVGNNNATTNYSAYGGGVNAVNIMSRIWKVQETGTDQGSVYIKTSSSRAQYLVVSADVTFTDADTWVPLSYGAGAVNLANGQYFTFASSLLGPGGVSTNLALWNETNVGITTSGSNVTGWADQTAVNTFAVTGTPQYSTAGINFNPSITFNGSCYFTGNTSITNVTDAFAVASIQNPSGVSGSGAVTGNTASVSGNYFFHTESGVLYYGNSGAYSGTNTIGNSFGWLAMNADLSNTPAANDKITVNGIAYTNSPGSNPVPYSAVPTIGSRLTEPLLNNSKVAEVILYNASKSAGTERSRIQSYLAVKYGLTLGNTSNLVSYVSSAGTTIWTGDATYQNNIIGIGKDNASGLEQQISTSQSTVADILTISTDNNFTNASGTHTAVSSDNAYLMIGNNNVSAATTQTTDLNTSVFDYRLSRVWQAQVTGLNQTIYFQFSGLASPGVGKSWFLLTSATPTFSSVSTASGSGALSSGVLSFNVRRASTFYFTLAVAGNGTPLPIELIDFTATLKKNKTVHLEWQTASEKNNDYFTIEKSTDLTNWNVLKKVKGAGNSSVLRSYFQQDVEPYAGISYYRLKQTDFDGAYSYSAVKQVVWDDHTHEPLLLYPTPTDNKITLEGNALELSSIVIVDMFGKELTSMISINKILPTKVEISVQNLAQGIYFIKTSTQLLKFNKI